MKNHFDFFVCTTSESHKPPNTGLDAPHTPNAIEICHGGGRSNRAATFLREHGYAAHNIAGGTSAWFAAGLPMTSENGEAPAVVH